MLCCHVLVSMKYVHSQETPVPHNQQLQANIDTKLNSKIFLLLHTVANWIKISP